MTTLLTSSPGVQRHRGALPPSRQARRRNLAGALYAAPMAVVVIVLFVVPLGLMIWMSVNHWPLLGASEPNGLDNYRALRDPLFGRALVFTLKYTVLTTVVLGLVSWGLALLVQDPRPGMRLLRTVYFLPVSVGLASASLLFYAFFNDTGSPLNVVARWLHVGDIAWLGTGDNALYSTIAMTTWRFAGYYMIILMIGLQSINPLIYEAARSDGAGSLQIMRQITLPLLRPTIALMLVLLVTNSLLTFDQFFILTGGRYGTATVVIDTYREAFTSQDLGRASAISVALLAVLIVINGIQLRLLRRGDRR
ncbi:sugar ABC transporter permease [Luedemannella flava]|uniref:Sugar ABC transporter permease n=1 Tax=Luedemannella flava TaxID=349316 RepID=A0ABN2MA97_9ACTN